jgi:hypothetical protein
VNFKEIANRLTGFSTPIFGVSWNPPKLESEAAQRLVTELEDKRVLFNPSEVEVPHHCVESIVQLRRVLTDELKGLDRESNLAANINAMRAACRKFLDSVQFDERIIRFGSDQGHFASWHFISAVGELRGVFGVHIAQISAQYGINIRTPLSTILPGEPDET